MNSSVCVCIFIKGLQGASELCVACVLTSGVTQKDDVTDFTQQ